MAGPANYYRLQREAQQLHSDTSIPDKLNNFYARFKASNTETCMRAPTVDAISIALHTALSHLDKRNTYVRMLFIDYSSAFNTLVPTKVITKLRTWD